MLCDDYKCRKRMPYDLCKIREIKILMDISMFTIYSISVVIHLHASRLRRYSLKNKYNK